MIFHLAMFLLKDGVVWVLAFSFRTLTFLLRVNTTNRDQIFILAFSKFMSNFSFKPTTQKRKLAMKLKPTPSWCRQSLQNITQRSSLIQTHVLSSSMFGDARGGGLGLTPPLKLIRYKNCITCAKEIVLAYFLLVNLSA